MSNAITEIDNTDLVFIFGYNPADSTLSWRITSLTLNATGEIIVCDPRKLKPRASPICTLR